MFHTGMRMRWLDKTRSGGFKVTWNQDHLHRNEQNSLTSNVITMTEGYASDARPWGVSHASSYLHTAQYKEMFVKGSSERRDDGEAHADRN